MRHGVRTAGSVRGQVHKYYSKRRRGTGSVLPALSGDKYINITVRDGEARGGVRTAGSVRVEIRKYYSKRR